MARRRIHGNRNEAAGLTLIVVILAFIVGTCSDIKERFGGKEEISSLPQKTSSSAVKQMQQEAESGLEVPKGNPNNPSQILVREGYTASYNKETRIPNWVAWHLTADRLTGSAKRKNADFMEDTSVPTPRADDYDYYNSGYDRGHLCPAADNKMSATAMEQSFLFTNICPQEPNLNRGDWNELEISCRKWAKKYGDIYIVSGPILYDGKHKTIGKHKITVPEAFFKVVLRYGDDAKAIGFIYKNEATNNPKNYYVNTVDQVERITGIDFFPLLPNDIEAKVEAEADINDW